jgi:hypothetical protein
MAMASLVPAVMTRTAWPAGTALEALAGASTTAATAFRAATTTIGASSTAVWTATAIVAAAITSAAAEGALESLARIPTNARGLARKFFAWRGCAAAGAARGAGFAGQQDDVVLGDVRCRGGGNEIAFRDVSGVGALGFFLAVSSFVMAFILMMRFVMFGAMFASGGVFFVVKSKRCVMLGTFVRGIGFRVGTIGGAAFFDLGGFVVGELGNFGV